MKLLHLSGSRLAAIALAATVLTTPIPAAAQLAKGEVTATCNIGGAPAQLYVSYTVYGDYALWTERTTGRFADIISSGYTTTYWKGYLDTAYGRFTISGENSFVEAHPVGGYYSDKRTLEIISTGPQTFVMKDFFADGQPMFPCQITGRS